MQCTEGTRSTVRTAARTAALVAMVAALVTGGLHAAQPSTPVGPVPATTAGSPAPATLVVALPRIGASNRAW
jgi:hypothetical protein